MIGSFPVSAKERLLVWLVLLGALSVYAVTTSSLGHRPRLGNQPEFSVRLPIPAQILMAAGDRHLAANLDGFRVLVAETAHMRADDYRIQAELQKDIAWLNPAHEDNYYIAAAILPWGGQLDAAQYVLKRAAEARVFDWQPLFYYGFNIYHFLREPARGADVLLAAVPRAQSGQDQLALQNVAALWIEKGYRLSEAAGRVEAMAKASPPGGFRKYLLVRAARLRDLETLRGLAARYKVERGRGLARLQDLVDAGLISMIPVDPLEVGFAVDASGMPVFADSVRRAGR
jgi:hypothetical protein